MAKFNGAATTRAQMFHWMRRCAGLSAPIAILFICCQSPALANLIPLGADTNYTVLYDGTGGHNLQIANDIIHGNIGVGGTGHVQFSGPGTISGSLAFSAANTGQYSNSNISNVGPTSVSYGSSAVTTALAAASALSAAYIGGTNVSFTNAGETINESAGTLETIDGVATRVFNVTAYSAVNTSVLHIVGDGTGDPVVFDFDYSSNVNLGGTVAFSGTGLTSADQVLFNFQSSGQNISLTNNGQTFEGILLAPNDKITVTNTNLTGRVFGGGSNDMQIVSGGNVYAPSNSQSTKVPEPGTLALFILGLFAAAWISRSTSRDVRYSK